MSSIVAENPREMCLLLLRRLTSSRLAERLLSDRAKREGVALEPEVLAAKAIGVSSAVESALGYLSAPESELNLAVVSRYYAMLQFTIAEHVASPNLRDDLAAAERHTRQGHGLAATTVKSDSPFPQNYVIGVLGGGHFNQYLRVLGAQFVPLTKRLPDPVEPNHAEFSRTVSIADLFRRIPELSEIVHEHLGLPSLAFHVGNEDDEGRERRRSGKVANEHVPGPGEGMGMAIFGGPGIDLAYLSGLDLGPLKELREVAPAPHENEGHFHATLFAPFKSVGDWASVAGLYRSGLAGHRYVVPALGVQDPYVLHAFLLYGLSIIARYLPDLWKEIMHGRHNEIRSLIEFYLAIVDRLIPEQAIERITGQSLELTMPGSLFGPV